MLTELFGALLLFTLAGDREEIKMVRGTKMVREMYNIWRRWETELKEDGDREIK
jgi:hypothetical protein